MLSIFKVFIPPSTPPSPHIYIQTNLCFRAWLDLGWVGNTALASSFPVCGDALQADSRLSFTSAEHGQMTVLVHVKYCEGFVITFLVF